MKNPIDIVYTPHQTFVIYTEFTVTTPTPPAILPSRKTSKSMLFTRHITTALSVPFYSYARPCRARGQCRAPTEASFLPSPNAAVAAVVDDPPP